MSVEQSQASGDVPPMTNASHMSVAEVAERVGLHQQTVRRAIKRGDLRAVKVCSQIRIAPEDYASWLDGHEVKAAQPSDAPSRSGLRGLLDVSRQDA